MDPRPVRVMIVDDHPVVRSGLSAFLDAYDDLEFVGEASNGAEAIAKCPTLDPEVILMDLVMPGTDGAEATRRIKEENPRVQVIALTSFRDEELVQNALRAGAISYMLKNASAEELATAIRSAREGKSFLSPEAAQVLISSTARPTEPHKGLTEREIQVLQLMVDGMANPEIAGKLFLSRSTVKFHVSNILLKLEAASRTEAVSIAIRERLVK